MKNKTVKPPESLVWKTLSHETPQRSSHWYLGLTLVGLGLIAFAIYNHSLLMGLTFIFGIIALLVVGSQAPRQVTYKLTPTGISAGKITYPYKVIKKFWITYNPPEVKLLNFETSAYLNNVVSLQLGDEDPVAIKIYLNQYLPEDLDREESLSERLARNLKI